jgi:hypothetical protein
MVKCHYAMNDLPRVPDHFVDLALSITQNWQDHLDALVNRQNIYFNNQESRYTAPIDRSLAVKPTVDFEGRLATARQQPRFRINNEWEHWVKENIYDRFIDTGVSASLPTANQEFEDSHGGTLHTDGVRSFCLFYIIKKDNDDQWTRWYRLKDGPLIPKLSVNGIAGQFLSLTDQEFVLVDETCMPLNTWIYADVRILHHATNHLGERIAIHVSLEDDVFGMFEHNNQYDKELL